MTSFAIDASTAEQAEVRTLAWIYYDHEDDLRGASATAVHEVRAGRWRVDLLTIGEY